MAYDREPPHNDDAERAMLGSVFIKPTAMDVLSDIQTDDLFLPVHREIFDAMRAVAKRGWTIDPVTVIDQLKSDQVNLARLPGGISYLNDLANAVPTAENVSHYAAIVGGAAMARRVIATCAEIASSAYGTWNTPSELLAETRAKISRLELRGRTASRRIGEDVNRVVDAMEKRGLAPSKYGVTTGLRSLDEILGPLRPDNLIAIAANPGKGKTALAWNTALRVAARGIPALYFTLEMSRDQLIERGIAVDGRIDTRRVSQGLMDKHEWHRVTGAIGRFDTMPLWINDDRLTIGRLISELRVWRALRYRERLQQGMDEDEAKLAIAFVDYAQLVEVPDAESRYEAMGQVSRELKLVSKPSDCCMPIVECLQLNRENTKSKDGKPREPIVSDIRDSGNFEQDADAILFPWKVGKATERGRPNLLIPNDIGALYQPGRVLVRKNRNGAEGDAKVIWEPEYTIWRDRDPDDITTEEDA